MISQQSLSFQLLNSWQFEFSICFFLFDQNEYNDYLQRAVRCLGFEDFGVLVFQKFRPSSVGRFHTTLVT